MASRFNLLQQFKAIPQLLRRRPAAPAVPGTPTYHPPGHDDMFKPSLAPNLNTINVGSATAGVTPPPAISGFRTPPTINNVTPNVTTPTRPVAPRVAASTTVAPPKPTVTPPPPIYSGGAANVPGMAPVPPAMTPPSPTVPTPPAVSPEALAARAKAEEEYRAALAASGQDPYAGEAAQASEDLANLNARFQQTYYGLEGQGRGIVTPIIRGQQEKLSRQESLAALPLQARAATIEAKRVAEVNKRQAALEASKYALDRADAEVKAARGEAKDVRTETEDKRRFEAEQAEKEKQRKVAEDKLAEEKRQADQNYKLSQDKFEEDKRQFGEQYAIDSRKVAIDEAKQAAETAGKKDTSQMLSNIQLVDDIMGKSGAISGAIQTGSIPFTAGSTTKNKYEQLKGILALDKRTLLKGSGQISDYESKVLDRAASELGRNQTEADFKRSLQQVRGVFMNAAGMEAPVKITAPSGEVITGSASRAEIDALIAEGNRVDYQ